MRRLALISDYLQEQWPSMDLCAEMLEKHVAAEHSETVLARTICPRFRQRAAKIALLGRSKLFRNTDRFLNRWWDYPRHLESVRGNFSFFHICDHSYAHLVHRLPRDRTGVYCHDLDAFRCLLNPNSEPRPKWFRAMMRRTLTGMQKANIVFFSTQETKTQVEKFDLIDPRRLVYAPYGISPEFSPLSGEDQLDREMAYHTVDPFLLHVGSCIPRKRVDVLLDVFARVRASHRSLRLIQVGGTWTAEQQMQIDRLGIPCAVSQLRGLSRRQLAALYRRAELVLQTSEAEGFGLPVLEALACGSVVVASDISVLREVGSEAVVYCPVGNRECWTDCICKLLHDPSTAPDKVTRLARAAQFSWTNHARVIVQAYQRLAA